jgi:hypothetical protein
MERFTLEKISNVEVYEQWEVKISNRFAAFENFDNDDNNDDVDISRAWESVRI